jgi:AcrR family transcriptional regulator
MTERRPPTKRQLQAAETRERMLAAAGVVFARDGYRATTVGAITKAANTAHGTFYLYFRNKDDALIQVLQDVTGKLLERPRLPADSTKRERVEATVRGYVSALAAEPGLYRALLEGMLASPTIEAVWLEMREEFVGRITSGLDRVVARGELAPLADTSEAARALVSMCEWHAFIALGLGHDQPTEDTVEHTIATVTDVWSRAVWGS